MGSPAVPVLSFPERPHRLGDLLATSPDNAAHPELWQKMYACYCPFLGPQHIEDGARYSDLSPNRRHVSMHDTYAFDDFEWEFGRQTGFWQGGNSGFHDTSTVIFPRALEEITLLVDCYFDGSSEGASDVVKVGQDRDFALKFNSSYGDGKIGVAWEWSGGGYGTTDFKGTRCRIACVRKGSTGDWDFFLMVNGNIEASATGQTYNPNGGGDHAFGFGHRNSVDLWEFTVLFHPLTEAQCLRWTFDPLYHPCTRRRARYGKAGGASGQTITPTGLSSGEAIGSHTLSMGGVNITPTGIASGETIGSHQVNFTILPSSVASGETIGSHTLSMGAISITPTGLASGEAFGTAQVNFTVLPSSIASGEAIGSHTLAMGAITVTPTGIASAEAIGSHQVDISGVLSPSSIASGEAFGTAQVNFTILPSSVASGENVPSPTLVSIIEPSAIGSGEAFGTATLAMGAITVTPSSIVSGEAFGTTQVNFVLLASSIASAEAFGTPQVNFTILCSAISSGEAFGTAVVSISGDQTITPGGISSGATFGTAIIVGGTVYYVGSVEFAFATASVDFEFRTSDVGFGFG